MADHIDSQHHELIVDLDQVLEALDQTIYYLESFDPSLVRSAVANYLISKHAKKQGIEILLSGEGGDEVFCGYMYLKKLALEEQFKGQIDCLKFLHNNASLRLDHMNQCNQVRVVAPLISGELLNLSLTMAPELKQKPEGDEKVEKWIFRKTFESDLPDSVVWRLKAEFSQGSGSAGLLPGHFEQVVDDAQQCL
ncbi:MAG: asparagine synthase-related protein [Alphaproteobacteria bacterium]